MKLSEFIKQLQDIQESLDKDVNVNVFDTWNRIDVPIESIRFVEGLFSDSVDIDVNLQILENI